MLNSPGNGLELGQVVGAGEGLSFEPDDRYKHLYVCGGTGVGKSKFLEHLIRQDILAWRHHRCGMMLLDPHGSLYDGIVAWLARNDLKRPIVAIDLSQDDYIAGYNPLRPRPGAEPAVVVENMVEAISHVWGQADTVATPQFSQWAFSTLMALYEKGYTLAEAVHLTDRVDLSLRRFMTRDLKNAVAAKDSAYANTLKPKEFQDELGSTLRRLRAFEQVPTLKAMVGQSQHSLDLRTALDDGTIILVALSRQHAKVSARSASILGTLLLTDLWTAAQERGKRKGVKPFRLYLDEFQEFITPSIATSLDQARGYGLQLTMSHQFPRQLLNAGVHGERLYDSVLENASTKAIFRLSNPENLKPLAYSLFMGVIDPDQEKFRLYATKVLKYERETFESHTRSTSSGQHRGNTTGRATGRAEAGAIDFDNADREAARWNEFFTDSDSDNAANSEQESDAYSEIETLVPKLGKEISQIVHRDVEEQLFVAMSKIFAQEDRHFVARVVNQRTPKFLYTPEVKDAQVRSAHVEEYLQQQREKWPFFKSKAEAMREIEEREAAIRLAAYGPSHDEPATGKRRTKSL
jgi:hypothetical protein